MEYKSEKYSKKPSAPVSKELAAAMPPEFRKTYELVRHSEPMAALLAELVDADILPEKYQMKAARLLARLSRNANKTTARKVYGRHS